MNVRLVSGYIPIPGHPRGPEFYEPLRARLQEVPLPLTIYDGSLEDTWLWQAIRDHRLKAEARGGNPAKDTIAYHCVTHEKTAWLTRAACDHPDADVLVWVDVGVFYLPRVTADRICHFAEMIDDKAIYFPAGRDLRQISPDYPCWRFLGTVLSVPAQWAARFHAKCQRITLARIRASGQVEWEINTWARAELQPEPGMRILGYPADHNGSLFDFPERSK